jgi:hypothetical protein
MGRDRSPKMGSNFKIFEDRGDPWVSPREGREKFGRNTNSENPDVDSVLFAKKATKVGPPAVVKRKKEAEREPDIARKKAAIALALKRAMNNTVRVEEPDEVIKEFKFFSKGNHEELGRIPFDTSALLDKERIELRKKAKEVSEKQAEIYRKHRGK